jgi:hypothetical protein
MVHVLIVYYARGSRTSRPIPTGSVTERRRSRAPSEVARCVHTLSSSPLLTSLTSISDPCGHRRCILALRVGATCLVVLRIPRRHLYPRLRRRRLLHFHHPGICEQGEECWEEALIPGMVRLMHLLSFSISWPRPLFADMSSRGACYFNTENNNCPTGGVLSTATRNANIKNWAAQITAAGVPWMYWQVLPNQDPHVCLRSS